MEECLDHLAEKVEYIRREAKNIDQSDVARRLEAVLEAIRSDEPPKGF